MKKSTQPTVIFDIDGTVADITHRRHWVATKPKNWPAFNAGMAHDKPHLPIIWLIKTMFDAGCILLGASGRGAENRIITVDWLEAHGIHDTVRLPEQGCPPAHNVVAIYDKLYMRSNVARSWVDLLTSRRGKFLITLTRR